MAYSTVALSSDWSMIDHFAPSWRDVLYTLQNMPKGEHSLDQIMEEYESQYDRKIPFVILSQVVNVLEVEGFVTFRRTKERGSLQKYVQITEKGKNFKLEYI